MPFPVGVATRTLTFGRYSAALGTNVGGSISVKFDTPMLHLPTGEVVTGTEETVQVDAATGSRSITVPVTVTDDLVANWRDPSAFTNQRLRVELKIPGYLDGVLYVDIHPDDPAVIDFDQLERYTAAGGVSVVRAAVSAWMGLSGNVTTEQAATALETAGFTRGGGPGAVQNLGGLVGARKLTESQYAAITPADDVLYVVVAD